MTRARCGEQSPHCGLLRLRAASQNLMPATRGEEVGEIGVVGYFPLLQEKREHKINRKMGLKTFGLKSLTFYFTDWLAFPL